ncbi:transmembrane protein, putative (macronuclear) [Tetrahymena thermophila SB210]|uniref:Transmembrane protein, putative n=1 Tax=Tetrahymena thermophila (strain SB210) TaxID=312017 RepID=W7XJB5_TETTS|nr:transmembrane protein, putative [Tetrahymena thermophila SB210]EWS75376.1 transmembrane protein, putative [Tetrahymena thermophila SB210]|eukprot:XP_012652050.1 transmembrane protein, putative [Tetrahymena thermophila SB210]
MKEKLCFDSLVNGVLESSCQTRCFWIVLEARKCITVVFLSKYLFENNNSSIASWVSLSVSIVFCLYMIITRPLQSKSQNFIISVLDFVYNIILIMIGVIISGKYSDIQTQYYLNNQSLAKIIIIAMIVFTSFYSITAIILILQRLKIYLKLRKSKTHIQKTTNQQSLDISASQKSFVSDQCLEKALKQYNQNQFKFQNSLNKNSFTRKLINIKQ